MKQMLLGSALELGKEFLKGKAEEKKAIQQRKINQINNDSDWETKMAEASSKSWKDEYLIIVLTLPVLFIGYGVAVDDVTVISRVQQAFEALSKLPEWYQYLLYIGCTASFGIKGADALMKLKK